MCSNVVHKTQVIALARPIPQVWRNPRGTIRPDICKYILETMKWSVWIGFTQTCTGISLHISGLLQNNRGKTMSVVTSMYQGWNGTVHDLQTNSPKALAMCNDKQLVNSAEHANKTNCYNLTKLDFALLRNKQCEPMQLRCFHLPMASVCSFECIALKPCTVMLSFWGHVWGRTHTEEYPYPNASSTEDQAWAVLDAKERLNHETLAAPAPCFAGKDSSKQKSRSNHGNVLILTKALTT